ncbi:hypothetical protein GCM10018787_40480 [Streptomyces thermodiastaticus]|nr:hypothetical protein GCM10018787_40480 [Streptomyces thermodiastaticus]
MNHSARAAAPRRDRPHSRTGPPASTRLCVPVRLTGRVVRPHRARPYGAGTARLRMPPGAGSPFVTVLPP